ncbi:hypothetical protein Patl1_15003 [Pistacia atlantica]|uniref:Uncharacterized protein n=1 Tax=Pistacia atlantica TaxID=434234 RepID=A0ACC1B7H2_9ROSI|nr:hypothetical protein Patl1_15003 [Pistacia atlantica]
MAGNGNAMSSTQPLIPVFTRKGYEYWSIRMKTLLTSQDLLHFVENGYDDSDNEIRLKDNKKKDSKALAIIQQAVHDSVFSRIATATTSKQAWSIAAIEESKDLSVFSFDELMRSLQAHESRINRSLEKNEEKAFQVKEATIKTGEIESSTSRGYGSGGLYGRGCGRGRKADCWYKDQQVNYATKNGEESMKSMFKELDETRKMQVKLGNGKEIQVEGKGTVAIKTSHGKVKLLHNVQFVPDLGYNLLSVGQLMAGEYSVVHVLLKISI